MSVIYLIGSLRNPEIPVIGAYIRSLGFEVFDDWHAAGPIADDSWRDYEKARGHTYVEALKGYAAKHVFSFDYRHLNRCDIALLAYPAGRSGHLEFGYCIGLGKSGYILLDEVPERYDVMLQFANDVAFNKEELAVMLEKEKAPKGLESDSDFDVPF